MAVNGKLEGVFFSRCLKFVARQIKPVVFVVNHIIILSLVKMMTRKKNFVESLVVLILVFPHFLNVG
jgi:hypothetical protein